jgi:hypothetical protein
MLAHPSSPIVCGNSIVGLGGNQSALTSQSHAAPIVNDGQAARLGYKGLTNDTQHTEVLLREK